MQRRCSLFCLKNHRRWFRLDPFPLRFLVFDDRCFPLTQISLCFGNASPAQATKWRMAYYFMRCPLPGTSTFSSFLDLAETSHQGRKTFDLPASLLYYLFQKYQDIETYHQGFPLFAARPLRVAEAQKSRQEC